MTWLPQFLKDARAFSYVDAGLVASMGNIAGIPGCMAVTAISDRLRRRKLPLVAFASAYTAFLVVFFNLPASTGTAAFASCFVAINFAMSLWVLFFSMVPEVLPNELASIGLGLVNGVGTVGFSVVTPIYGTLVDVTGGYAAANALLMANGVLMALIFVFFMKETYGSVGTD